MKKVLRNFVLENRAFLTFIKKNENKIFLHKAAIINGSVLFFMMSFILIGIGAIFKIHANITYLFLSLNMSLFCSLLLYNYKLLLDVSYKSSIMHVMIIKGLKIIYYQSIMYLLSMFFIFGFQTDSFSMILSLIVLVLTMVSLGYLNFNEIHDRSEILYIGLIQGIGSYLIFYLTLNVLGIENVTIGFISSYMIVVLLEIAFFTIMSFEEVYLFQVILLVLLIFIFLIVLGSKPYSYSTYYGDSVFRKEIAFRSLTQEESKELYKQKINFETETVLSNPLKISYGYDKRLRHLNVAEYEDYIYMVMVTEYANQIHESILVVLDQDNQIVYEQKYDNKRVFISYVDETLYMFLDSEGNASDERFRLFEIYDVEGTTFTQTTVGQSDSVELNSLAYDYYFSVIEGNLYYASTSLNVIRGWKPFDSELELIDFDIVDAASGYPGYVGYLNEGSGYLIYLNQNNLNDYAYSTGLIDNGIVVKTADRSIRGIDGHLSYTTLDDYLNDEVSKEVLLLPNESNLPVESFYQHSLLIRNEEIYVIGDYEVAVYNLQGELVDFFKYHSSFDGFHPSKAMFATDDEILILDSNEDDGSNRLLSIDLENPWVYALNGFDKINSAEIFMILIYALLKRKNVFFT